MRIVLSTPPADGWLNFVGGPPPMGLLYVAACLQVDPRTAVHVVDPTAEGLNAAEAAERIVALEPDLFGISVFSTNIERGIRLLKLVKELRPTVTTILGGVHATLFDELLLDQVPELDFAFRGEAEQGFPDLVSRLMKGADVAGVAGLSHRRNGTIVRGTPGVVEDLDALMFPDCKGIDGVTYYESWGPMPLFGGLSVAGVISSRGCPYKCSFCSKTSLGPARWRTRSAENIFEELNKLSHEGCDLVVFHDDNFSRSVGRLNRLCEMLLTADLNMRFWFSGSVHHLSQSTLDLMQRVGFDCVAVGVESGSDKQLKRINKPATRDMMAKGIQRAKKSHMWVHTFFVVGTLGENSGDHEESKRFVRELRPHFVDIFPLSIYPGSQLWGEVHGDRQVKTVADSKPRLIYEYEGQLDGQTVIRRGRELLRTFLKSWLHPSRLLELVHLIRYNRSFTLWFRGVVRRLPQMVSVIGMLKASFIASKGTNLDTAKYMEWKKKH
ncbi:MAG: radical SAM protein [Pseudomonadota bacterium]